MEETFSTAVHQIYILKNPSNHPHKRFIPLLRYYTQTVTKSFSYFSPLLDLDGSLHIWKLTPRTHPLLVHNLSTCQGPYEVSILFVNKHFTTFTLEGDLNVSAVTVYPTGR